MPLTDAGQKAMANMTKEYGPEKGKQIFYALANKRKKKAGSTKLHLGGKSSGVKY